MKYFTTDTHFGHPLVSVLRGFTTFDPGHTQYDALLSSQGRKAAEDWAKGVVLDDSRLNFRKAADTDAHDEAIVANINRIVGEDDELWILGSNLFKLRLTACFSTLFSITYISAKSKSNITFYPRMS